MNMVIAGLQPGALEIHCLNLPRMFSWYRLFLQGELIYRDDMQVLLSMPGGWHLALLDTQYPPARREASGLHGLSLQVSDIHALRFLYQRLLAQGIHPYAARKNGLFTWLQYRDPDGALVKVVHVCRELPSRVSSVLGDHFDPELLFVSDGEMPDAASAVEAVASR